MWAWLVVHAWRGRARTWIVAASVVTSGAVLVFDPSGPATWLEQRAIAGWVMEHAPALYNPEFEIFAERSAHGEAPPLLRIQGRNDGWKISLPVAHGRASGEVTKLPVLLAAVATSEQPHYVHPPPGMVWAAPGTIDGVYASKPWP